MQITKLDQIVPNFLEEDFPLWPIWDDRDKKSLVEVLESGVWAGSRAKKIQSFSKKFASFQGANYGICLANGTVTIEAALVACNIGEGDEVIVPAITFFSTASAVVRVNAVPVIVDVEKETLNIDTKIIEKVITKNTKAIIAVHVGGMLCDLYELKRISKKYNLRLIEDCAHSHGSSWNGLGCGAHGDFGSFSFQHSKLLTSGEGGMLLSNDKNLIEKAWNYSNCGREINKPLYHHATIGSNYRMTEWQAAILDTQLEKYPKQLSKRNESALFLDKSFSNIEGIYPQKRDQRITMCGYYCYIFYIDNIIYGRDACKIIFKLLSAKGVPLSLPYPSINELDVFKNSNFAPTIRHSFAIKNTSTPNSKYAVENSIWFNHRVLLSSTNTLNSLVQFISQVLDCLRTIRDK